MEKLDKMVDMSMSPEEQKADCPMVMSDMSNQPRYPYGLAISLGQDELDKLGVDYKDWNVGDAFNLDATAKITSISEHENEGGKKCRVEMQITHLSGPETDAEEEAEQEKPIRKAVRLPYRN